MGAEKRQKKNKKSYNIKNKEKKINNVDFSEE